MKYMSNKNDIHLVKLDILVTTKCNLRCRYCSNLMQYYPNGLHRNIDTDNIINGIEHLFNLITHIDTVYILGGEPFANPDLPKILKKISKYRQQTRDIYVVSNGTIKPNDDMDSALIGTKIPVLISRYPRFYVKQGAMCEELNNKGIEAKIFDPAWTNRTQYIDGVPETFYKYCHKMTAPCVTLKGNELHYCEFSCNANELGTESRFISLDENMEREQLYDYLDPKEPFEACRFCNGAFSDAIIEAGKDQCEAPLKAVWSEQ